MLSSLLDTWVGALLMSNVIAPIKALNLPYFGSLRVTDVTYRARGKHPDEWGKYWHGHDLQEPEMLETPAMVIIRGVNGKGQSWSIAIDAEEGTVGVAEWGDMMGDEYMGSAGIGIAIFGLPMIIMTCPLWITTNLIRFSIRVLTPLDIDSWFIFVKLALQLDSQTRKFLWRGLRSHKKGQENSHNLMRAAEYEAKIRKERIDMLFQNRKDNICEGPFMLRYASGCAEPGEILDDLHDWRHRVGADQNVSVHEWVGMTAAEFADWRDQKKTIDQILEERKSDLS